MMQLQVTNIRAQIGISKYDAVLSVRQPGAGLEIAARRPVLNARTEHPQVRIDQSRCFAEIGRKGISEFTGDFAREGMGAVLEAVGRMVQEGNRMAAIKNKADAVAEIAMNKALPPPAEFNITLIPKSRPQIDFVGGVSFNPEQGIVNINFNPGAAEIQITRGRVELYMQRRPEFAFKFVGENVDLNV